MARPPVFVASLVAAAAVLALIVLISTREAKGPELEFDWSVPARYDGSFNTYALTAAQVVPIDFPVNFTVSSEGQPCDPNANYRWSVNAERTGPCEWRATFPIEGEYRVSVNSKHRTTHNEVVVQDWLVVSLGDSASSGEGSPQADGKCDWSPRSPLPHTVPCSPPPVWADDVCNRSDHAGPAVAAKALEDHDNKTSVTFVHLACSGSAVGRGVLDRRPTHNRPSQLEDLRTLTKATKDDAGAWTPARDVDAVMLTIGANDVEFGDVTAACVVGITSCSDAVINRDPALRQVYPDATNGETVTDRTRRNLSRLPAEYDALATCLNAQDVRACNERPMRFGGEPTPLRIPTSKVYLGEYFDPTTGSDGQRCDRMLADHQAGALLNIARFEADWATNTLTTPLNQAGAAAATKHNWNYVDGVANGFRGHGYCAAEPDRWITTMTESFTEQGSGAGSVHPNIAGYRFYGERFAAALTRDLESD